jgi:hypothetical protein
MNTTLQEPVNRARRAKMAGGVGAVCVFVSVTIVYSGLDTNLAKILVEGLLSIAELTFIIYFTGSIIDSSNIASILLGRRLGGSGVGGYTSTYSYPESYTASIESNVEGSLEDVFPEAPEAAKRKKKT